MVSFRREDRERVARGEITVTFRLWKSAKVRAGKTYASGFGGIEVQDVRVIPAAFVSEDDIAPSGCADIAAIWALAGEHTGARVGPDTLLHRVQFRYVGHAPVAVQAPVTDVGAIAARLRKMDRLSTRGPWTFAILRLIDSGPRVPARVLAAELGWQTLDFKANVRKLKALGLTVSHEVGYELSEVGRRCLAHLESEEGSGPGAGNLSQPRRGGAARSPRTRRRSRS